MTNAGGGRPSDPWASPGALGRQPEVPPPAPSGPFSGRTWDQSLYGVGTDHRSARGLATAVTVLLLVMAVLCLARAAAHANRASELDDLHDGRGAFVDGLELADADDYVALSNGLYLLGGLLTGIMFVVWQYRHATNAQDLSYRVDGLKPGWAIGGWFVPIANLVLPGLQIYGASRESDPDLPVPPGARRGRGSGIVVLWAAVYGVGLVVDRVGAAASPDHDDYVSAGDLERRLADAVTGDRIVAVASALFVVAAILASVMVNRLTVRQDERAAASMAAARANPHRLPGGRRAARSADAEWQDAPRANDTPSPWTEQRNDSPGSPGPPPGVWPPPPGS